MNSQLSGIVVTGYSAISAAGIGISPILALGRAAEDAFAPVPADLMGSEGYRWGKVAGFKASDFMSPMKARKMDRCSQFAVAAAALALKDAGLDLKGVPSERVGIALGSGFCGVSNAAEFLTGYFTAGVEGLIPMIFPNTVPNSPASNASIEHGFNGPNVTIVQRFCSAESAFIMACRYIEEGRADVMLTGGSDEIIPLVMRGLQAMGMITHTSVPFGEGCGMLVLERESHAAARQASIKAHVEAIATIGMLAKGQEREGFDMLAGPVDSCSLVSLSGVAADMPALLQSVTGGQTLIDAGRIIGRSLAMGGISMSLLVNSLSAGRHGLHLAASPEGPYFAIRFRGGSSVQF